MMILSILTIAILSCSQSVTALGPYPGPCEFMVFGDFCYWTEVHATWDTTYPMAREICDEKRSSLAVIRDQYTYDAIMDNLREKIPDYWDTMYAWIGNEFRPATGEIVPSDSYIKWYPINEPRTESESQDNLYMHLYVSRQIKDPGQGMGNIYPEFLWPAVVCEYKL